VGNLKENDKMKWDIIRRPESNQLEINSQFLIDDLNEHIIIESIGKVKDEIVKIAVEEMIKLHLQEIINKIDISSLVNTVYLKTALEMSKQLTEINKEK
jgi:hypothetical protein